MNALTPILDEHTVSLEPFVVAGVFDSTAVHVARVIAQHSKGLDASVLLGIALAVRATQYGHTCIIPAEVHKSVVLDNANLPDAVALPWPEPGNWVKQLANSPAVYNLETDDTNDGRPLVWDGKRLYLERYWRFERDVAENLQVRAEADSGVVAKSAALDEILTPLFDDVSQRAAAEMALTCRLAVICGGPGTGKTTTMAGLVRAVHEVRTNNGLPIKIALAAPTGKAARRMTEAVHAALDGLAPDLVATTLHKLLGSRPRLKNSRDRFAPLPHDMVIIDETSMVALPMFARLLEAVRENATFVVLGDPGQLQSIEAGSVLAEIIGSPTNRTDSAPLHANIAELTRNFRNARDATDGRLSRIPELANAIRDGQTEAAIEILRASTSTDNEIEWIDSNDDAGLTRLREDVTAAATDILQNALSITNDPTQRDPQLRALVKLSADLKVLCATRYGTFGTYAWTKNIEEKLGVYGGDRWYLGRPIIVTVNDPSTRLLNGDVGVVVESGSRRTGAFIEGTEVRELARAKLSNIDTWWAMTIHKSQGSEFKHVVVSLPSAESPSLTRELLYTAVTRAREKVTVVGSEEAIRAAISNPAARASGLGELIWG